MCWPVPDQCTFYFPFSSLRSSSLQKLHAAYFMRRRSATERPGRSAATRLRPEVRRLLLWPWRHTAARLGVLSPQGDDKQKKFDFSKDFWSGLYSVKNIKAWRLTEMWCRHSLFHLALADALVHEIAAARCCTATGSWSQSGLRPAHCTGCFIQQSWQEVQLAYAGNAWATACEVVCRRFLVSFCLSSCFVWFVFPVVRKLKGVRGSGGSDLTPLLE